MFSFLQEMFTLETVKTILIYVEIFFVIYLLGYSTFLFVSVVSGGNELFENIKKKKLRNEINHDYYVPISVIVPAYNEELTIAETIKSLLNLDYKIYEIIVVNDGSKDKTLDTVINTFNLQVVKRPIRRQLQCKDAIAVYENVGGNKVQITVINKVNGGKADSINMGINASKYPYFVCMDADSILQADSLTKIAVPVLENQNVVAVGSMIRISNDSVFKNGKLVQLRLPKKLIPALQVLEYERSFLASRILLDKFNANLIISGAFGLFKKDAVISVGGYKVTSMGEDMELIVKLHSYYRSNKLPYKIKYAYDAVCWTQAPERLRDLIKQRKRWHIGLLQSLTQHKSLLTSGSYWYYLIYELLSPFVELVGMAVTLLAMAFGLLNIKFMIMFFLVYALFGSMLTVISFLTRNFLSDEKVKFIDVIKAFLLCIPENIVLRFIMAWTRIFAILFYRGKKTKWGSIKRVKINYNT
ncbi:MAG: glycosyltransferase [Clostridium sp.]|uniref:glycosyltransferase family 2 protein n=1 Tax=Clostridium sp. TaxID=1506 RepID=UPI003060EF68